MERIVIDTSALFEYFYATEKGVIVQSAVDRPDVDILVPLIVLSELSSKFLRRGIDPLGLIDFLEARCTFVELNPSSAVKSGYLHAKLRKVEPDISLGDCIVMQIGEEYDSALILTTDLAFKYYKNAKIL